MASSFYENITKGTTPTTDVLSCLANLSNDEIFTPPDLVNRMLDMLPQELFSDPNTRFLDPACKTGVFLREITKRLLVGLEPIYPDLQERIDHILHEQVFGIAITELTSLLSRRSLYCSKYPNGKYSISHFDNPEGNVRFRKVKHTWDGNQCKYCGASKTEYDRGENKETHAYEFIHNINLEEAFKMGFFDVIISNVPYQLSDNGAQSSAKPIYHLFIEQAKKLNPTYIDMIVPSRWFTGGKGLDNFRAEMLKDDRLKIIHDFPDASECFQGVEIKGGVNYFLWDKNYHGDCEINTHKNGKIISTMKRPLREDDSNIFIRHNDLIPIYHKVKNFNERKFSEIVSARKPYGIPGDFFKNTYKYNMPAVSDKPYDGGIKIYGLENLKRTIKYAPKNYPLPNKSGLDKYKIFMSESYGAGEFGEVPAAFILGEPYDACTETFLQVGPFNDPEKAKNCISYMKTKFFRTLVGLRKNTQHATQTVYSFVPLQDFSKPWTDEELYAKYGLTEEEIRFIEENVQAMEDK